MSNTSLTVAWPNADMAGHSFRNVVAPWCKSQWMAGHRLEVEFRLHEDAKTDRQRAYYHGIVLKCIADQARPNGQAFPMPVWFQSAPAIAGGRCGRLGAPTWTTSCFNPRPPLLAGDAPRCQGIANSSLFPYRARTPAAPSKGQTKIACEKEKPFGNNTLRSARTCLMQRHHFRFAALTIAWHPCPTAPAAHQNPRP